jgi:hypothetical protein
MQKDIHSQNQKIVIKSKWIRIKHKDLMDIINRENGIDYSSIGIEYKYPYKMLDITYDHTFLIINEELFLDFYSKQTINIFPL